MHRATRDLSVSLHDLPKAILNFVNLDDMQSSINHNMLLLLTRGLIALQEELAVTFTSDPAAGDPHLIATAVSNAAERVYVVSVFLLFYVPLHLSLSLCVCVYLDPSLSFAQRFGFDALVRTRSLTLLLIHGLIDPYFFDSCANDIVRSSGAISSKTPVALKSFFPPEIVCTPIFFLSSLHLFFKDTPRRSPRL